jgi:hypothetical protein
VSSTRFRRRRGGRGRAGGSGVHAVAFTAEPGDAAVLRQLFEQLDELVAPPDETDPDPLAQMVGIGVATEPPDDPVLARLFPDAYPDDPKAASEFRRYTEQSLRARKHAAVELVLATLEDPGRERMLTEEEASAWLGALNDLRLALGTRLEITEDIESQYATLTADDPRLALFEVYHWVSVLQETLVHCLL